MKRRTDFEYNKRTSSERQSFLGIDELGWDGKSCMKVAWTAVIASINGAHYHAWFPECDGNELKRLKKDFRYYASWQGDPVSFSYDWLPN